MKYSINIYTHSGQAGRRFDSRHDQAVRNIFSLLGAKAVAVLKNNQDHMPRPITE